MSRPPGCRSTGSEPWAGTSTFARSTTYRRRPSFCGHGEGLLFPWVVSDFALIDAIECGIVKVPRVPVSDNALGRPMPVWRNLWNEIREGMPKEGRSTKRQKGEMPSPDSLPEKLLGALHALYEHYEKTFTRWTEEFGKAGLTIPPVFIVVCQNTSHSKLLYD